MANSFADDIYSCLRGGDFVSTSRLVHGVGKFDSRRRNIEEYPELTMYLSKNANDDLSARLFDQVRNLPQVHHARLVSADEALEDFKQLTGLDTIIQYVPDNPLPTVIIVQPYEIYANPTDFQQLADKLRGFELVDAVEVDLQWLRDCTKLSSWHELVLRSFPSC